MSDPKQILAEALEALAEAAESERPMRIGHDVARVLHSALLDAADKPHQHVWQPLGFTGQPATVVMACTCGAARSTPAEHAA